MNRARAGSRGRARLPRRTAHPLVALTCALSVAACFGQPEASTSPTPVAPSAPPSVDAGASSALPSESPSELPSASVTDPSPSASPSAPSESGSPDPSDLGNAATCSGNDDNRRFFLLAAEDLAWDVYCPVLPAGWFVGSGNYTRAGGGKLTISYNGPGDSRLELSEGVFCSEASGCVPDGTDVGAIPFGDREGVLVALTDGSWAVVVDRGAGVSWQMVGVAVGDTAFRAFSAALTRVD